MTLLEKISPIPLAFGGAALSAEGGGYGFGPVALQESLDALRYCFEQGITIFDTAPIYGFGESERRLAKAFKGEREKVFIISKGGVSWEANKRVVMTNDPVTVLSMFEQSLRDLKSDYIDLYMIHWPDEKVDIRRPLEVLHKLKNQGKIRHIGLCNTTVDELEKAWEIDKVEVVQSEHHFLRPQEEELLNFLKKKGISFLSWGTFDKGIITGRVTPGRDFDPCDSRARAPWWKKSNKDEKIMFMQKHLLPFLKEKGHTGIELALGYNLAHPQVSHCLCGGKTVAQWKEIMEALHHLPEPSLLEECQKIKEQCF